MKKIFKSYLPKPLKISSLFFALLISISFSSCGSDSDEPGEFNPGEMINHHIMDSHVWEIMHGVQVYLPVIVYGDKGIDIFLSSNFFDENHEPVTYKGYSMDHDHITAEDGSHIIDFSITKNVLFIFIDAILMLVIFFAVARGYKKNEGKAPKGIQSFFDSFIFFVCDELVKLYFG